MRRERSLVGAPVAAGILRREVGFPEAGRGVYRPPLAVDALTRGAFFVTRLPMVLAILPLWKFSAEWD